MKRILICLIVLFSYSLGFAQEYKIYVVQPKDTLGIIAAKYKIPVDELAKMNNRNIKDLIFVGEGIKIPIDPVEKKKDIVPNYSFHSFSGIMPWVYLILLLIVVFFYVRKKRIKTTSQRIIKFAFADNRVFEVKCPMEKEMISCPICKDFNSLDEHRFIRHLKEEYKNAKKTNNKKNLKLFKKKEVVV